jgi:ferric-dicitrate binding protein FerR (iron transport regulator)
VDRREYTVNELVNNASFRRMVRGTAALDEIERWNNWIEESDQNRMKAKSAVSEIVGFEFEVTELPDPEQKWADLYADIIRKQSPEKSHKSGDGEKLKWFFRVAAVLLLSGMASLSFFHFSGGYETGNHAEQDIREGTITTAAGEKKTLIFTNGAKVVLNSNSALNYSTGLTHHQTIDVTLEGEAYFDVESDPSRVQPVFAVRTPDGIIRDIGTKFSVTVQKDQSRVVLVDGLVEVEPVDHEGNLVEGGVFRVKKGEIVEFNQTNILKREVVNSTLYTSWATGFMQFDQTGVSEFAEFLESRYGVNVQIEDTDLTEITLDGAVYFSSLEDLVRSVSEVTGIPIYRSEDRTTLFIGNPNE